MSRPPVDGGVVAPLGVAAGAFFALTDEDVPYVVKVILAVGLGVAAIVQAFLGARTKRYRIAKGAEVAKHQAAQSRPHPFRQGMDAVSVTDQDGPGD